MAVPAKRIVTTFKPATLSLFCMGLADRIVGIDNSSVRDRFHLAVYPEIAGATRVGSKSSGLNFETILSLKPDLVVLYSQKDGVSLADRLTGIGIPAVVIKPETFGDLAVTLKLLGEATGEELRAEKAAWAMTEVLDLVTSRTAAVPDADKMKVYYAAPRGFFSTAPGNMLQSDMIERAGGVNVAGGLSGYFRNISPEQFVAWNPDFIAVARNNEASVREIVSRPEIRGVKGVASSRIYLFPADIAPWDFPSPLSALGVLWFGKRLYPDRFEDIDLDGEVNRFHETLFGKSFTSMGGHLGDRGF